MTVRNQEQPNTNAGYGKAIIASHVLKEKRDYLKDRADYIGWSPSSFLGAVVDYWFSQGAPKLHARDRVMPIPAFKTNEELDQRKTRYKRKPNTP